MSTVITDKSLIDCTISIVKVLLVCAASLAAVNSAPLREHHVTKRSPKPAGFIAPAPSPAIVLLPEPIPLVPAIPFGPVSPFGAPFPLESKSKAGGVSFKAVFVG